MKTLRRYFTNLGISQIFLSLLVVILIMSYSSYSIYRSSISNIYNNIKETNKLATQSAMLYFDNVFQSIHNLIHSLEQMPPYEFPKSVTGNLNSYEALRFTNNLSTTLFTMDFIEEIVVTFEDERLAFTSKGTVDFNFLFTQKYYNSQYTSAFWNDFLGSEHPLRVFPSSQFQVYYSDRHSFDEKELMIIASDNRYTKSNKDIFIVIDTNKLMTHFGQTTFIPGSSLKILDHNHNTIYSTDENLELVEVLNDLFISSEYKENPEELSVKTEDYEYTIYTSEYNDFVYLSKVPYEFKNLNTVAIGNRTIIIISIVSAILISVFISFYLYRPVRRIMATLGKENSKGDDFSKIQSGIKKILQENNQYSQQLAYVEAELKRNTFIKMIDDYTHSDQHEFQLQKYYPEFFNSPYFMMGLLHVREISLQRGYTLAVEKIAEKIAKKLEKEGFEAQVFHYLRDQFLVIISLQESTGREKIQRTLNRTLLQIEKEDLIGFELWMCVSKEYKSTIQNCGIAYKDVENAQKYRLINEKSKVMDASVVDFVWNIYFPYENMERMTNYIMSGKIDESITLIKETLRENYDRNIHEHQFKYVAKSIFFYMYRNIGSMSQSIHELYRIENDFLIQQEYVSDYEEVEALLIEAISHLGKFTSKTVEVKLNPAFITQYIDLHYMENMYLEDISAVMETTPKYFSNYFKKTFGVNYVEYLNKVRLSHARRMLKESTLSIGEIGSKTGYLNSSTFTTTFKKYYGISPSEYRRQAQSKLDEESTIN